MIDCRKRGIKKEIFIYLTRNARASLSYGHGVQSVMAIPFPIKGPLKSVISLVYESLMVQIELRLLSVDMDPVLTPIKKKANQINGMMINC